MILTNIQEAKTQLSKLMEQAAAGEEIIIAKAGKPVVRLVKYETETKPRRPGSMRGLIKIRRGFDEVDKETERLFYGGAFEPPARHSRSSTVARRK